MFQRYILKLERTGEFIENASSMKMDGPRAIANAARFGLRLHEEPEEVMTMIAFDSKLVPIGIFEISRGTVNKSLMSPREIFKRALLSNASSIALVHNHPSDDPTPSKEDITTTAHLARIGKILGIPLLDHIIITDKHYASLVESNSDEKTVLSDTSNVFPFESECIFV